MAGPEGPKFDGPKLRLVRGLGQIALGDTPLEEISPAADSSKGPTVAGAADGCVMGTSPAGQSLRAIVKEDPRTRLSSILTRPSSSWDPKKAHELADAALKAFAEVVLRDTGEDTPVEVRLS